MTVTPDEFQRRIDESMRRAIDGEFHTTPLTNPKTPKELEKVPETRPPHLDTPFLSDAEAKEAYDKATEAELARLDYEKAKQGKTPMTYYFRKWVGPAVVGVASLSWVLVKSCG